MTDLKDLQPEIISNNQTWEDLFDSADIVFEEMIKDPTQELAELRNITADTDPFVISQTLKQLGFNLPPDLIAGNEERLAKAIYMLPLFHETSGTTGYVRPIEFLLGRDIDVRGLFTDDYQHFHETPLGPMLMDGGDWFETTHINLAMEILPSDQDMILPVGQTLKDRLIEAFYEFAPIQLVVNEFRYMVNIYGTVGLAGTIEVQNKRYLTIGEGHCVPVGIRVISPNIMREQEEHQFKVEVYFSNVEADDMSPVFGYAPAGIDTDQEIIDHLDVAFPDWDGQVLSIDAQQGMYAWFAIPVASGQVTFTDVASLLQGGWDGAGWPEGVYTSENYGPIIVERMTNGVSTPWYLYRTDYANIGAYDFRIDKVADVSVPVEPIFVDTLPMFGLSTIKIETVEQVLNELDYITPDSETNWAFDVNTVSGQYAWFAIPASAGEVTFLDPNGFSEVWDGATWEVNDMTGESYGPLSIYVDFDGTPVLYHVYRVDFSGVVQSYTATWPNVIPTVATNVEMTVTAAELLGTIDLVPYGFYGGPDIKTAADVEAVLEKIILPRTSGFDWVTDPGPTDYNYFLIPSAAGPVTFLDTESGFDGAWDGAQWEGYSTSDTLFGPLTITLNVEGQDVEYNLYRTDFIVAVSQTLQISFDGDLGGVETVITIPDPEPYVPPESQCKTRIEYADTWSSNKAGVLGFTERGLATTTDLILDTDVVVKASYLGFTNSKKVTIVSSDLGELVDIDIVGADSILSGDSIYVQAAGIFENNEREVIYPEWSCTSPFVNITQNGLIETGEVSTDTEVIISAVSNTTQGIEIVGVKRITLLPVANGVQVSDIYIVGPDEVTVGDDVSFQCMANFNNGSSIEVIPMWTLLTSGATISNDGRLTITGIDADVEVQMHAEYTHRGKTVRTDTTILLKTKKYRIVDVEIMGPNVLIEKNASQYTAIATWDNGARSQVYCTWKSSKFSIDEHGVFTAGSVDTNTAVTIEASIQQTDGSVLKRQLAVSVKDTPLEVSYITIRGPESAKELPITSAYRLEAQFNDDTLLGVPDHKITWSIVDNPLFATIDTNGNLSYDHSQNSQLVGIVEIKAEYTFNGKTYEDSHPVVLVPDVTIISNLTVEELLYDDAGNRLEIPYGTVSSVQEGSRIKLFATAIYSHEDGEGNAVTTEEEVTPLWTVRSADPINNPYVPATIVVDANGVGILQGRRIDTETTVIVEARYFKERAEFPVVITNYIRRPADVPLETYIKGPTVVRVGEIGSFSHMVLYGQGEDINPCLEAIAVSGTWSLPNTPATVATITSSGYLTTHVATPTRITVRSEFFCGTGDMIEEEIEVDLLPAENTFAALDISGPDLVLENSTARFTAMLTRIDGSVSGVSVEWTLSERITGIAARAPGEVIVTDIAEDTTIDLIATYREGIGSISQRKQLTIAKLRPIYGTGPIGLKTDAELEAALTSTLPSFNALQNLSMDIPINQYGYYATPVSVGVTTFTQQGTSDMTGWDGASWPLDGSVGPARGPLVVTRTFNGIETDWYLYRTDYAGGGSDTWVISYEQ